MKGLVLLFFGWTLTAMAADLYEINLQDGIADAIKYSPKIQANQAAYQSALQRIQILTADNMPQAFVDGQYRHQTHLISIVLPPPINRQVQMGSHDVYSAGLNLTYQLADFGQNAQNIQSGKEEAQAEEQVKKMTTAELILSVKNIFYRIFFQNSQLVSLHDAWLLALAQEKDMAKRYQSGACSRLDYVSAKKETVNFKLKFLQMQRDFSATIQDWLTICGQMLEDGKLVSPVPQQLGKLPLKDPSLLIGINRNLVAVAEQRPQNAIDFHPALLKLELLGLAQRSKAESVKRSFFPKISVGIRSSWEYPDGNSEQNYYQHAFFTMLSLPLWDGGRRVAQNNSYQLNAQMYQAQKAYVKREMEATNKKMQQMIQQLQEEIQVAQTGAEDAQDLAELTYKAFLSGRSNFLQVQAANLKVLEGKTQVDNLSYAKYLAEAQLEYLGER